MPPQDHYKVLGVDRKATAGRDQEGVSQARAPVPPRSQPRRREGRGALQADLAGARRPRRPRQAQGLRPRAEQPVLAGRARGQRPAGLRHVGLRRHPVRPLRPATRGRPGGGPAEPRAERGRDLEAEISIAFDQAIAGAEVPISVPTYERCGTCAGTGAKPGTAPRVCPRCQGRGIESEGQGLFSISQPCSRCGGAGTVIDELCPTCHGEGRKRTVKRYRVNMPAGVREGSRIRLAGKGEPGRNGGPTGDLYVVTHVPDSPVFARKGDNLEVEVPLTIPEALRGANIEVPTLDGRKTLRVPPGTQPGTCSGCAARAPKRLRQVRPRRHPLPLRARPAVIADRRAGGGRRRAREGLQRRPPRQAVPAS